MQSLAQRERYRNSGGFRPLPLFFWGPLTAVLSVGLGVVLYLAYLRGLYIILIAPLFAALPAAGMVYLAVRQAHCRNRWIAGAFGLVAGLLVHLSYYHSGLVHAIGIQNAHRVDILPKYVYLRLQTDVVADVGKRADAPKQGELGLNAILFMLELALICVLTAGAGIHRAKQPYSESSGEWMLEQLAVFPPGAGAGLVHALEAGMLGEWVQSAPERHGPAMPNSHIILHYDPTLFEIDPEAPVYLTVKENELFRNGFFKKPTPSVRTLLNRVRLLPDEVASLRNLFTALRPVQRTSGQRATPAPINPTATVRVEQLPADYSGRVLSTSYRLMCRFHAVVLIGMIVGGVALLIGGPILGLANVRIGPAPPWGIALAGIALGIACLAMIVKAAVYFQRLASRTLHRSAGREFSQRPEVVVDPADPNAIFVDVTPREHWTKSNWMLETAGDVGFLRIDKTYRMLVFEGDKERYWIPAASIISCEVEQVEPPSSFMAQTDSYPHFVVVVKAGHRDGPWEAPFSVRHDPHGSFRGRSHQARARELQERILQTIKPVPEHAG